MAYMKCLCCVHYKVHEGCTVMCDIYGRVDLRSSCSGFEPDDYAQCHMSVTNRCVYYKQTNIDGSVECGLHGNIPYRDRCYDYVEEVECTPEKKGCFLTTAACGILGKRDDCYELESLRKFRDTYLSKNYPHLVLEYYAISPVLSKMLTEHSQREKISLDMMQHYILKCIVYVNLHHYDEAIETYKEMVYYLQDILEKRT